MSMDKLAKLYVQEVVILHGVSGSIVSNHDQRFTSRFWQSLQKALVMSANFCPHLMFNFGYLIEFVCLKNDLIESSDN